MPGKTLSKQVRDRLGMKKHTISVLARGKPSPTLTTLPDDIIHYSEARILTVRECARLQSFPDDFHFVGPYTTGSYRRRYQCPRYSQVGNAVAPRVAEFLGTLIINYWKCGKGERGNGDDRDKIVEDALTVSE